jgi:hypothetical protein
MPPMVPMVVGTALKLARSVSTRKSHPPHAWRCPSYAVRPIKDRTEVGTSMASFARVRAT